MAPSSGDEVREGAPQLFVVLQQQGDASRRRDQAGAEPPQLFVVLQQQGDSLLLRDEGGADVVEPEAHQLIVVHRVIKASRARARVFDPAPRA